MGNRKYFQDTAEFSDIKKENDEELVVRAAAVKEMVQDYGRYKAIKPAKAIQKSAKTVDVGSYLTDGHPPEGVVMNQGEIIGEARNPEFDDEKDVLYVDLAFDKSLTPPKVIEEIKDEERTDVSIGFYADEMMEDGEHNGKEYDRKQTNIVIDHIASLAPDAVGRCSSEDGCGIIENMDKISNQQVITEADPEDVSEGDKVRGDSSGGNWYGVVDVKETDGTVSSNIGEQEMEGTEDNPAFRVELYGYDEENEAWSGRDEFVVHRAEAMTVIEDFPETGRDVADFAADSQETIKDSVRSLREKGISAKVRDCNCGEHHAHIEISRSDAFKPQHQPLDGYGTTESESWDGLDYSEDFVSNYSELEDNFEDNDASQKRLVFAHYGMVNAEDVGMADFSDAMFEHHNPSEDGDVDRAGVIAGRQRLQQADLPRDQLERIDRHLARHLREDFDEEDVVTIYDWAQVYDEHGASGMPKPEKQDKFIREDIETYNVDTMGDQDNQPDISEDELEKLRNKAEKADELEEERAEELRERLVDSYGVDEEKVEEMDVEELQTFEDTLDASDLVQDEDDEDDEDADEDDGEVVDTRTGPNGEGNDDILEHDKTNEKGLIAADTNSFEGKA